TLSSPHRDESEPFRLSPCFFSWSRPDVSGLGTPSLNATGSCRTGPTPTCPKESPGPPDSSPSGLRWYSPNSSPTPLGRASLLLRYPSICTAPPCSAPGQTP